MTEPQMNMLWQLIANQARSTRLLLKPDELKALRDAFEHAESFGPFLDPTAFMLIDQDIVRDRRELLDATIKYVTTIEQLAEREKARVSTAETASISVNGKGA